jgi:hypothetical protein
MLADPDGFDNPLLTGLREASDSTLENSPTLTRTVKAAAHAVGKNHSRQLEVASSGSDEAPSPARLGRIAYRLTALRTARMGFGTVRRCSPNSHSYARSRANYACWWPVCPSPGWLGND